MSPEMRGYLPQLRCTLRDVAFKEIVMKGDNQCIQLIFQRAHFLDRETHFILFFSWPEQWPVECFGSQIGGKKRDAIEPKLLRSEHCRAQRAMVHSLHRGTSANTDVGSPLSQHRHS